MKLKAKGQQKMNSMSQNNPNFGERVERLETTVESFVVNTRDQFLSINVTLEKIQDSLSSRQQTNWPLMVSIGFLALAVWAAAIHPLNQDLERQVTSSSKLAEAVLIQDDKIRALQIDQSRFQAEHTALEILVRDIQNNGSQATAARLILIEYKLGLATPQVISNRKNIGE